MGERIGYERVGQIVTVVHTVDEPTDHEWNTFLGFLGQSERTCQSIFVYSVGGGPNTKQRKGLAALTAARVLPIAVVTPSRVTRAIGVAVSWFNPHIQVFSPGSVQNALAHLELSQRESADVVYSARQLSRRLGVGRAEVDLTVEIPVQHVV